MTTKTPMRTVHIASDHAGFFLKEEVKNWLVNQGYHVTDHGARQYEEGDDFPDFIALAAQAVAADPENACGVIFGGSGQGEAMLANRFPKVRATVVYCDDSADIVRLSREHNDANVLSFGARFIKAEVAIQLLEMWLTLSKEVDSRHERRLRKIETITRSLHTSL